MREFFRGLKRKVGVVTLVMAFLVLGWWCRSLPTFDEIVTPMGNHTWFGLISIRQSLVLEKDSGGSLLRWGLPRATSFPWTEIDPLDSRVTWYWTSCGFGIGEVPSTPLILLPVTIFMVPYWSILIPLTLLSAWLLLSKRPTVKLSEASSVEGIA